MQSNSIGLYDGMEMLNKSRASGRKSTLNNSMYGHTFKASSSAKKTRDNPFDITESEFNKMSEIPLNDKAVSKIR